MAASHDIEAVAHHADQVILINHTALRYLLLTVLAATIVASIKLVGVVLM